MESGVKKMKNTRKGMGRGLGIGYKNIVPIDTHIHSLSAKGVKTYNYKTPRGQVSVAVSKPNEITTAMKYDTKSVSGTPLLSQIKSLASTFDMNDYARAYFNEFDSSYVLYGNHGLQSQIAYFLTNVKAKTPAQKEAKQKLLSIMKDKTLKAQITSIKGDMSKEDLANELKRLLNHRGYDANVRVDKGHIKIGDVRLSEKYLDEKGYNLKENLWNGKKRRGRILNWNNWVEVNDTINDVMDKFKMSGNASSLGGKFKIRKGTERMTEDDWSYQQGENVGSIMHPIAREDDWQPEGIPRTKLKKRGYGYYVPKAVKKEYGLEAKGEWYKDRRPEEGDEGWSIYYRRPIHSGKFKGRMSGWKRSGVTIDDKKKVKKVADKFAHDWKTGYIMIRKVKFTNHSTHPMKEKYQMLSRKWVRV